MPRDHVPTQLSAGQRLAYDVCRDLGLPPPVTYLSRALIDALARQKSWTIVVRLTTPAETVRWSLLDTTGTITPVQPDVWEIVVHSAARPVYREMIILALLAPLLRGVAPPEGCVRHAIHKGDDELIGEDFASMLVAIFASEVSPTATTAGVLSPALSDYPPFIMVTFPFVFLLAALSEMFR